MAASRPSVNLHFHRGVGELLLRQADGHGHVTAFAIGHLQVGQRGADPIKCHVGAEGGQGVGENFANGRRRKDGIAHDQIFFHGEMRAIGGDGNDVGAGLSLLIQLAHLFIQGCARRRRSRGIAGTGELVCALAPSAKKIPSMTVKIPLARASREEPLPPRPLFPFSHFAGAIHWGSCQNVF